MPTIVHSVSAVSESKPTGNATPADVLSGKTFSNASGTNFNGEMPNYGSITSDSNSPKSINGYVTELENGYAFVGFRTESDTQDIPYSKTFTTANTEETYAYVLENNQTTNSISITVTNKTTSTTLLNTSVKADGKKWNYGKTKIPAHSEIEVTLSSQQSVYFNFVLFPANLDSINFTLS